MTIRVTVPEHRLVSVQSNHNWNGSQLDRARFNWNRSARGKSSAPCQPVTSLPAQVTRTVLRPHRSAERQKLGDSKKIWNESGTHTQVPVFRMAVTFRTTGRGCGQQSTLTRATPEEDDDTLDEDADDGDDDGEDDRADGPKDDDGDDGLDTREDGDSADGEERADSLDLSADGDAADDTEDGDTLEGEAEGTEDGDTTTDEAAGEGATLEGRTLEGAALEGAGDTLEETKLDGWQQAVETATRGRPRWLPTRRPRW